MGRRRRLATTTADVRHVFLMTGADPNTAWLRGCVALDEKGFVKTGQDLTPGDLAAAKWPVARPPLLFETNQPGVFAVGDVRANERQARRRGRGRRLRLRPARPQRPRGVGRGVLQ